MGSSFESGEASLPRLRGPLQRNTVAGSDEVDGRVVALAETRRNELQRQLSGEDPFLFGLDSGVPGSGGESEASGDITYRIQELEARLEEMLLRYTEKHPEVIAVRNVNAAQLVPLLRPLQPQSAHLAAYPSGNILIVSDRASNVARIQRIIERIDQQGDTEVDIVRLEHASANEVVRVVNTFFQQAAQAEGGGGAQPSRVIADERSNSVLIGGQRAPVRDRVCMDQCVAGVSHLPGVRVGDEVVLLGRQGAEHLPAEEVAQRWGTINYDVTSGIMARVERVFV